MTMGNYTTKTAEKLLQKSRKIYSSIYKIKLSKDYATFIRANILGKKKAKIVVQQMAATASEMPSAAKTPITPSTEAATEPAEPAE